MVVGDLRNQGLEPGTADVRTVPPGGQSLLITTVSDMDPSTAVTARPDHLCPGPLQCTRPKFLSLSICFHEQDNNFFGEGREDNFIANNLPKKTPKRNTFLTKSSHV